jgi:uncharacterized membrane protein YfcA
MESIALLGGLWFIALLIIVAAGTIQGMTGFGAALLAGPALTLFLEPKLVVVIIMVTAMSSLLCVAYTARNYIYPNRVLPLIVPAVFGIPLGSYILHKVSSSITGLSIAIISILFSILLLLGYSRPFKREAMVSTGFGFASGVMCAGVGMGGPPLILFLSNQGWPKEIFRATVAIHFLFIATLTIVSYMVTGVVTGSRAIVSVSLSPASVIGFYLGNVLFHRINAVFFARFALSLILFNGLASLAISIAKML